MSISGDQSAGHAADAAGINAGHIRDNAAGIYDNLASVGKTNIANGQGNATPMVSQYLEAAGLDQNVDQNHLKNPYSLTPAQQTQLNGHVDEYNKQRDSAIQQMRSHFQQNGITDPRYTANAEALIGSHYNDLVNQHQANFAEQARQTKQNALANLMQYYNTLQQIGTGQQEGAGAGTLNIANQVQGVARDYQGQQNQNDQQFAGMLSGLASLGGTLATGGIPIPNLFGGTKGGSSGGSTEAPFLGSSTPTYIGNPWDTNAYSPSYYGGAI